MLRYWQRCLLIEPVWNRNDAAGSRPETRDRLLIEPVWNRNDSIVSLDKVSCDTFNRTSMESKQMNPFSVLPSF